MRKIVEDDPSAKRRNHAIVITALAYMNTYMHSRVVSIYTPKNIRDFSASLVYTFSTSNGIYAKKLTVTTDV